MNLYPKTEETPAHPFLNNPFKADADVISADAASEYYFGDNKHWVMGPEIQGGWWQGIPVLEPARRQTYLTVIGHGLKGLFVYYFNEGDNFGWDYPLKTIQPFTIACTRRTNTLVFRSDQLPDKFWNELQQTVDHDVLSGWDVREVMQNGDKAVLNAALYFDAPLDRDAQPRDHYFKLKEIGEKLIAPYGRWLGRAVADTDHVCIVKDDGQNVPSAIAALPSADMSSACSAGLVGYLMQAGINPKPSTGT